MGGWDTNICTLWDFSNIAPNHKFLGVYYEDSICLNVHFVMCLTIILL